VPIINIPYTLDNKDHKKISKYPFLKWEDGKYDNIKKKIKKHYCVQQKKRCAYCNTELASECHSEHIEHIVDKAFKPHWKLEPFNLCLSCSQCNTKKGEKHTLHEFYRRSLIVPRASYYYKIIHAHFDTWHVHLFYEDNYFIKPHSVKGENTIDICGLYRHLYIDKKMKLDYNSYSDRIMLLSVKREEDMSDRELQAIDDYIDELTRYL
jgi:5-methylcytosine-specific restriction endonuclease McrA